MPSSPKVNCTMAEIVKRLNETMAEVNEVSKFGRASRKRSSQDVDNFLPCKRYRLDMNVVVDLKG